VEVSCKDPLDLVFFILVLFPNHATLSFFICWGVLVKDHKSDPLGGGYIVHMVISYHVTMRFIIITVGLGLSGDLTRKE
jgi:hypothetical protein